MLKIIQTNPYRLLGVYSTSSQREVVAHQSQIKRFLTVGREVSFPLDLNRVLPVVSRTEEYVTEANSKLTLPAEQLKYAQFWFAKCTNIDEIACGKLTNGDIDGAIEIWCKKATASSLQNLIVCALIKNQLGNAIEYAEALYSSYGNEFVKMVLGDTALATSDNLAHDFLNVLCEELNTNQFIGYITNAEWKEYVGSKSTKPLIDRISSAIDKSKATKGKGATTRLNAGTKLMNETKSDLAQLKQYVATSDLKYQMIADKLGLEILQCGIDYYNDSEEPDAARKAMVLQSYAQSVVVGKIAKDRCKENVDILKNIIANLPPSEVFAEDRAIKEELRKFCNLPDKICHAVTLLNNTKPHLQKIKSKLGSTNSYYLKVSTQVVDNALHNIIEEVNITQSSLGSSRIKSNPSMLLAGLMVNKEVADKAWDATLMMEKFDMESSYRNGRFAENKNALRNIRTQINEVLSKIGGGYSSGGYSSGGYSGGGSSSDDTNWGCIIFAAIAFIIFCISQCN